MKEFFDFRLQEELSKTVFPPDVGKLISYYVRLIVVERPSREFDKICLLQQDARRNNDLAIYSWGFKRKYSKKELQNAPLLALIIRKVFEPAGEDCGTVYDESHICPYEFCRVGAIQASSLKLPLSSMPRSQDIARTIAGEIVITKRVVELIRQEGFTGFKINPILSPKTGVANKEWYQLVLDEMPMLHVNPETKAGITPVEADENRKYTCPYGHVLGLNRLSELVIDNQIAEISDFYKTEQTFGIRSGFLRPEHVVTVSQRVYRALSEIGVKGCDFEVVHVHDTVHPYDE